MQAHFNGIQKKIPELLLSSKTRKRKDKKHLQGAGKNPKRSDYNIRAKEERSVENDDTNGTYYSNNNTSELEVELEEDTVTPKSSSAPDPTMDEIDRHGIWAYATVTRDEKERTLTTTLDDPLPGKTRIDITLDEAVLACKIAKGMSAHIMGQMKNLPFLGD